MIKPSILLSLFLGIIFAPDADSADEGEGSGKEESADESQKEDGPALTCLLFDNLGCNAKCMTIASAFDIKGSGGCTEESACQCILAQDDSLEGLLRAKFRGKGAEAALKKIKEDETLTEDILDILRKPFQTAEQIKKQIKEVNPAIHDLLTIAKKPPVSIRNLVERNESLNLNNIQKYVAEKLKPILRSSALQLKNIDYKSYLKESLDGMTDEDLQSIVNQVRRTKNKKLSGIVDDYLKSKQIKETPSEKKDTLADAMDYLIINTFVNEIEKKKLAAKKPARKSSPAKVNGKKKPIDEEPSKKTKDSKSSTSKEGKTTKENSKNEIVSSTRFQLPGFDKNFLKKYTGNIDKTFKGPGYTLLYQKGTGESLHFTWEKNSDMVDVSVSSEGTIIQNWRLDNANIQLILNPGVSLSEVWDFGKSVYSYNVTAGSAGSQISDQWSNGEEDMETLQKYEALIDEWCNENEYLLQNPENCAIYHN